MSLLRWQRLIYGVRIRGQKKDISYEEGCPLQEEKSCSQKVSKEEGSNEESRPKEVCSFEEEKGVLQIAASPKASKSK
jgi:hypothetical protein